MLEVKRLKKEFVAEVYQQHLINDFIPEELKPLERIQQLMDQELYWCYGLYDEGVFVAYAFFVRATNHSEILIDYFAVCSGNRNKGYGGLFLGLLQQELSDVTSILFEVESGAHVKEKEQQMICQKRLAFYRNNGLKDTKFHVDLFGIDMKVLYLIIQREPTEVEISEALDAIYDVLFGTKIHHKHVLVTKEEQ